MRAITIVTAIAAGSAARILLSKLPFFRRDQSRLPPPDSHHTHSEQQQPTNNQITLKSYKPQVDNEAVLALLDGIAPCRVGFDSALATCTFCLESVHPTQRVRVTPCNHVFHAECLEQWVTYVAADAMNWRAYTVARDGTLRCLLRLPSCPNCSAMLDVLPKDQLRTVLLTAVARSLSLKDLGAASEMYQAGMVVRDAALRTMHVGSPVRVWNAPLPSDFDDNSVTVSSNGVLLGGSHLRHGGMVALTTPPARTRAEQRGWGRANTHLAFTSDVSPTRIAVQASS